MVVAYGCCVGSWDKFQRYVAPHVTDRPFVALSEQTSMAVAYNTILDVYRGVDEGMRVDALVLLHDDLEIIDPDAERRFLDMLSDPDVALVGVAGGTSDDSLAWWGGPTVGHQLTDAGLLDFGLREGDVALLEGSILVLSHWAVQNLRFDTRFPGFHGYPEICCEARRLGKRVRVVDVDTHHHTQLGFKTDEVYRSWCENEQIYQDKWRK